MSAMIGRNTARAGRPVPNRRAPTRSLLSQKEMLERRTTLLQSTLEHMEEGVSVFDQNGRLVAWNSRFLELLNLPRDTSEGSALADILRLQAVRGDFGPSDPAETVRKWLKHFYENLPLTRERITSSGHILRIRRRRMPDGSVMTLYADITEQKAEQGRIAEAWAEADRANRSKSAFLAHMSHELRTPLNAIIGFSELLSHGILGPITNERFLGYISDIHSSGMHLLEIVNDVLDMSKIEAGKLELSFDWVSLQQVIEEAIGMLGELAGRRKLDLVMTRSPDEIVVWADERALKQITLNLLSNAIKFSNDGGRIETRAAVDEKGDVTFEVRDYGIGMTADELERALQPFGQAQPITSRTYGGTGLGLPIVKGLIQAHGGRLVIESNVGCGTLVRVHLASKSSVAPPSLGLASVLQNELASSAAPEPS